MENTEEMLVRSIDNNLRRIAEALEKLIRMAEENLEDDDGLEEV